MNFNVREPLHSEGFWLYRRLFALLMAADAARVIIRSPVLEPAAAVRVAAFLAIAYWLWFRIRTVFATKGGLELNVGGAVRLIAWRDVADIREMPWMTLQPSWHPKLYQVDLVGDESLDFVGRRNARAIVVKFVRADAEQ